METVMDIVGCTRVLVDSEGLGVPEGIAKDQYDITPDIIFLRNDGWTLGAPTYLENLAYIIWKDSWTHFARKGDEEWTEISEY